VPDIPKETKGWERDREGKAGAEEREENNVSCPERRRRRGMKEKEMEMENLSAELKGEDDLLDLGKTLSHHLHLLWPIFSNKIFRVL